MDGQTIFVDPGIEPDFDQQQTYQCGQFQITFKGSKESWHFSKDWQLVTTQINPDYGAKYPIPKTWMKNQGNLILLKHLNYSTFLKHKDAQTLGEYDLHIYELKLKHQNLTYSLDTKDEVCFWADFDNYGGLVLARRQRVFIYRNFQDFARNQPYNIFDFEELIAKR